MWIHEEKDWPNFIWDDKALTLLLAEARHKQGRLLGKMEALGFPIRQEASLNILTADVVTSSAIEGERLDTDEVRSSIARRLGIPLQNDKPVGRDVEGIVEMMLDATQNFDQALTEERLFDWHAALFPTGRSGMHRITVGAWRPAKAGPMQVVSGPIGLETVHYEAPDASRIDAEMTEFLLWFETELKLDPMLKAGIAHLWFVSIHPFEDGNGRIARAIADMALARADGTSNRFYSMSRQIEKERKAYYMQLERQQKGRVDITAWLLWFLDCVSHAIDNAKDTLSSILSKAELWSRINLAPVNERQRLIINRMLDNFKGYMTTSKYSKLAKCSSDTALRDIRELVARHILLQNPGGGRSTSYRLVTAEELEPSGDG
ncbi:Fic family protein [Desulforhopalus sp. IMCC35007]|uniref:Fic family protein n=1 Tax=Desulforhopalus sp. IMCC35007 TaxID=2569543 RepID=UPI0010AE2B6E|nr:Fic family protein [Desulforhopalus sp. IMCC35007]TKB05841.1 Fic family protein [Desulforhopalus sp. IMCC35007]